MSPAECHFCDPQGWGGEGGGWGVGGGHEVVEQGGGAEPQYLWKGSRPSAMAPG